MAKILSNLEIALQHHQSGNLQQAEAMYRQVLAQQPRNADALHLLGVLAHQVKQSEIAIEYISQAIQIDPRNPNFYNSLGEANRALGNLDRSIGSYRQAIQLQPRYVEAHCNLGIALQAQGETNAAIQSYRQALQIQPQIARIQNNLGVLLKQQGMLDASIEAYQKALQIQPDYLIALNNLGVALEAKGEIEQAIAIYNQAIKLYPNSEDAYKNLGDALQSDHQIDRAIESYERAIALKTDFVEAHYNLGHLCRNLGKVDRAIDSYQKAGKVGEWNLQLVLPVLYDTPEQIMPWRTRFRQGLQTLTQQISLDDPEAIDRAIAGISSTTNFYLQYQGLDDTELQRQYGQLVSSIVNAQFSRIGNYSKTSPPSSLLSISSDRTSSRKIRIGYLSSHFRDHTVAQLFSGWLRHCDKDEFEVVCYYTGKNQDEMTALFKQHSDAFYHISENLPNSFERLCQQVLADQLDALIFTDIGMSPHTDKIAALRLAPIQSVAWGHPITSGLPTIDYFLSSDRMEPDHAADHYTEQLVRLPGIGISYPHPVLPKTRKSRADFNLSDRSVVYLCCQSLYKYLPQYDYIFAEIATQVPTAKFVFLSSLNSSYITDKFQRRLERAFAAYGLSSQDYCAILPRLDRDDYLSLNLVADIFLDSIDWSGGNTTLEAIACNLPIVTLPGEFMRGRHAYAMLQMLEIADTIAASAADYISIATRLGLEPQWRQEIVEQIQVRSTQLYDDKTCIIALEDFFKTLIRRDIRS